jgi:hypothetical protein
VGLVRQSGSGKLKGLLRRGTSLPIPIGTAPRLPPCAREEALGPKYPESQVHHYQQLPDGKEQEVQPYPRTTVLEIQRFLDSVALDEFLIESQYQVWSEDSASLWKFAEYLSHNDKIAVAVHSFGKGFSQSYAMLHPIFREGQFVIVMSLTKSKKLFDRLMPVTVMSPTARLTPISVLPDL